MNHEPDDAEAQPGSPGTTLLSTKYLLEVTQGKRESTHRPYLLHLEITHGALRGPQKK